MSSAQDRLLRVIEDEPNAEVLADIWKKIEGAPLEAARMLRSFEQIAAVVQKVVREIPEHWKQLDDLLLESELRKSQFTEDLRKFRKELIDEVRLASDSIGALKTSLSAIDDNHLNKANRIVELCEKLARAKRDGSLDVLKALK